jgi:hypothetical protein
LHRTPPDFGRFHNSGPSDGRERRFLHYGASATDARLAHRFGAFMLDFKIDVIHFLRPTAKTLMEGLQEMNVVKALRNRLWIIPRTRDSSWKDENSGGR